MRRHLGLLRAFGAVAPLSATSTLASSESSLPPLSAAGVARVPAPPDIYDSKGKRMHARLLQVQTVFRHGARLPVEDEGCRDGLCEWEPAETDKSDQLREWPPVSLFAFGSGDPQDPAEVFGPGRPSLAGGAAGGRLTRIGLQQAVELGAELSARYVDPQAATCSAIRARYLLPASWERGRRLVKTQSTRVERTVYTACGVVRGLYPKASVELEIALTGQRQDEFLVLNDAQCPRLQQLFRQGQRLSTENLDAAQLAVIDAVERGAGWLVDSGEWKLIAYRDWFSTRRAAGKAIPPAVERVAVELDHAAAQQMHQIFEAGAHFTGAPEATRTEALRLIIGRLWTLIVDQLSKPDGTLHLYSGHDWSVSPLLMCIVPRADQRLDHWPPFCSNLSIELWCTREAEAARSPRQLSHPACFGDASAHDAGRHVRVLYNGAPVELLCAPGRDTCTLAEFRQMVAPYCVRDFAAEGRAAAGSGVAKASNTGFNSGDDPRCLDK